MHDLTKRILMARLRRYFAKASSRKTGGSTTTRRSYTISGNRTMLEATHKFMYLQFWKDYKIYANELGIVYLRFMVREREERGIALFVGLDYLVVSSV